MGGSDVCATNLHSHEARPRSHDDSRGRSTDGNVPRQTGVTISYQKVQKVGGWWTLELVVDPDQRDLVLLRTLELSSDRPGFWYVPFRSKGERANLART